MNLKKIYRNEKLHKVIDEDSGKTIWTEENTLRRPKISDKSKTSIAEDIDSGNLESALNQLLEVVSGETKEEILSEVKQ